MRADKISNIKNKKDDIISDIAGIKWQIRQYEQFYANKFENFDKMDKFLTKTDSRRNLKLTKTDSRAKKEHERSHSY